MADLRNIYIQTTWSCKQMTLTDVDGHAVRKTGKTQRGTNIFGMGRGGGTQVKFA